MGFRAVRKIVAAAAIAGLLVQASCAGPARPDALHVVKVEGADVCKNYMFSPGTSFAKPENDGPLGIVAREGDLLAFSETGGLRLVPYSVADGNLLRVSIEPARLLLNGKTAGLTLTGDQGEEGWKWLQRAGILELESLRLVTVPGNPDDFTPARLASLERLAAVNSDLYLDVDGDWMLRPFLGSLVSALKNRGQGSLELGNGRGVEFLLAGENPGGPDEEGWATLLEHILDRKSRLRSYITSHIPPQSSLPEGLKALTVLETETPGDLDLGFLKELPNLQELVLGTHKPVDLTPLKSLRALRLLSLVGSKPAGDLADCVRDLPLTWISFPENVTQDAFDAVIRDHPRLQVVEIVRCDDVKDLRSLARLSGLEALMLTSDTNARIDPAIIGQMRTLRLLALPGGTFKDAPELVADLHKALPRCLVTEERVCLGSGWILALLPAGATAFALRLWRSRCRSRLPAASR